MDRAFGILEVRAVDEQARVFEGIANSASEDSHGTVIDPEGAVFGLPIPLFFHDNGRHSHDFPIGEVVATEVRAGRMRWFRAHVPNIADDGTEGGREVKRWVDRAWAQIKNKLVRGTSIEFVPIEPRNARATRWTKWEWKALAVVPLPSNRDATIQLVRSAFGASADPVPAVNVYVDGFDPDNPRHTELLRRGSAAAQEQWGDQKPAKKSPGVSGTREPTKPRRPMTLAEEIQQFENTRAAKVARQDALIEAARSRGETMDEAESEEFDTIDTEVRSIDSHLVRLGNRKRDVESRAVAVNGTPSTNGASQSRAGVAVVRVKENTEPGIGYARYAMSLVACNGNRYEAAEYAKRVWGDGGEGVAVMHRAAIAAGTTTDSTWAAPLVQTNYLNEFLELLRPATLLGRIPGLRRVPFNISMPTQTAGGSYGWTGEGKAKRVTRLSFSAATLGMAKATGIIVITKELARSSSPAAQTVVRDDMVAGIGGFLDEQFIDPTVAEDPNVSPASITNGVTGFSSSGSSEAQIRADFLQLLGNFPTGMGLRGVVLLMSETTALALGMTVNAVGAAAFPVIGPTGGSMFTLPVITSDVVGDQIVAVHAPSILFADDGGVEIDVSEQASVQMDSAPDEPTAAGTVMVSLWQRNLIGLRAERFINWKRARAGSVRRITDVAYVAADES